jgi:hypothetical protein
MARKNVVQSGDSGAVNETDLRKPTRNKLWYIKLGTGSLRMLGQIIKPNQRFQAYPEEIPAGFRDLIRCLDDEELQKITEAKNAEYHVKEQLYQCIEKKKGEWWVINGASKKPIHEQPMKYETATALQNSLNR